MSALPKKALGFFKRNWKKFVFLAILAYAAVTGFKVYKAVQEAQVSNDVEQQTFATVSQMDISNPSP